MWGQKLRNLHVRAQVQPKKCLVKANFSRFGVWNLRISTADDRQCPPHTQIYIVLLLVWRRAKSHNFRIQKYEFSCPRINILTMKDLCLFNLDNISAVRPFAHNSCDDCYDHLLSVLSFLCLCSCVASRPDHSEVALVSLRGCCVSCLVGVSHHWLTFQRKMLIMLKYVNCSSRRSPWRQYIFQTFRLEFFCSKSGRF